MESIEKDKTVKNCDFICPFCKKEFGLKKTLDVHIKTNKKCLSLRPKIDISCIWCKTKCLSNIDLEKHYKKCDADKYTLYLKLLEENKSLVREKNKEIEFLRSEKDKEIERLNSIIKDLTSKIKGDTTINNPITYNITLNCAKPLLLSKDRIIKLLNETCVPRYIRNGQEGLAEWFLNYVCRNDNNDIAIECTDKQRKKFRYEDENGIPKEISGVDLAFLLRECIQPFKKSTYYLQARQEALDILHNDGYDGTLNNVNDFEKTGTKFVNHVSNKTHITSQDCLITKK
jgi:hypothetical protein